MGTSQGKSNPLRVFAIKSFQDLWGGGGGGREFRVAKWYTYLQTKKSQFGKFGRVLQWKMLIHFMVIWYILFPFSMVYGHLVDFFSFW
jgi:hypothetical protein